MAILSKEQLQTAATALGLAEFEYEVKGVGTVRCRALSRQQAVAVQGQKMSADMMDAVLLSHGVIEPKMSAKEWLKLSETTAAGLFEELSQKIAEASGMRAVDAKEAYAQFRDDPGS